MNNNSMFREKIKVFPVDVYIECFLAWKLKGFFVGEPPWTI